MAFPPVGCPSGLSSGGSVAGTAEPFQVSPAERWFTELHQLKEVVCLENITENKKPLGMIADLPRSLYKYFGPDRVGIITKRLLRYTPLGAFNDPFEGRPELTGLDSPDELISIFDNVPAEETQAVYESLPAEIRVKVRYKHVHFLTKALGQSLQSTPNAGQSLRQMVLDCLTGNIDKILGVLCLSEVPDSLLMWAHYADSHTGFVLEFDSWHPHFHEEQSLNDELRRLRRVFYRETRPSLHLDGMGAPEVFLVKSGHWDYEREWRIIRPLSDATEVLPMSPHTIHLFSFPPQALKAVILGARATPDTTRKIQEAVSSDPELKHVVVRRAVPDPTHFHLRLVDYIASEQESSPSLGQTGK